MYLYEEKIKVAEIDSLTMYRMIYELLKVDFYYEAKCLVNIFAEEKTNEKELEMLDLIRELLREHKLEELKNILKSD